MATQTQTATATREFRTPGFMNTVASEWTKLTSVRSTGILLLLTPVLGLGMTALVAVAIGTTYDEWTAEDRASFEPIVISFVGTIFAAILLGVLGVIAVSNEYSSGMIRVTLTATPRRGRVLAAKVVVITVLSLVASIIVAFGTFLTGQAIFSAYDMESVSLGDSEALQAVLGVGLGGPLYPLMGIALAFLLRSTAGAITSLMAIIFAPSFFGGLLPSWAQENVLRYLPGNASDNVAQIVDEDSRLFLELGPAIAVVLVWLVIFFGAAYLALTRRDA